MSKEDKPQPPKKPIVTKPVATSFETFGDKTDIKKKGKK